MKRSTLQILLALTLIVPVALPLTGCQSPTAQTASYKTLASLQVTVDKARSAFLDQVSAGQVDAATLAQAMDASTKFNAAFNAALLTVQTTQAPAPANVAEAATAFLGIVALFIK